MGSFAYNEVGLAPFGRYPSSNFAPSPARCDFLGSFDYKQVGAPGASNGGYSRASDDPCFTAGIGTLSDPCNSLQGCNMAKMTSSLHMHCNVIGSNSVSNDLLIRDVPPLSPQDPPGPHMGIFTAGSLGATRGSSLTCGRSLSRQHFLSDASVRELGSSGIPCGLPLAGDCSVLSQQDDTTHTSSSSTSIVSSCRGSSDLSIHNSVFLSICIIVDCMNVDTQHSNNGHLFSSMSALSFSKSITPLLGQLSNHRCDKVSFNSTAWNSHGLLGSNSLHYSEVHGLKSDGANRLLTSSHISGLLEIHADELECEAFSRKWAHSHVCFWSITDDRNCGGAALCISRSFLATCLLCFPIVFVPGRALGALFLFPNVNLLFICIHSSPTWDAHERYQHFKSIQNCVPDSLKATTILCGDLNFSHDTIRFDHLLPDATISNLHKSLASLWEGFFHDFVEIAHDCPTFMRGDYLSQLDHAWTNILPAILLDLSPSASVVWQFGEHLGMASDHTPVRLSIGGDVGTRVSSIPKWVPKHPDFESNCVRLRGEVRILPGTPYEVLQRHKAIIKEAARLTIKFASCSAVPLCVDQKIYWSMTLLRHRHDLNSIHVVNATKSYKHLSTFVDHSSGSKLLMIRELALHIDELQYTKVTGDIASLPHDDIDSEAKRVKINRLGQYLTLWASRRRKITNLVIVDDNGAVACNASESAHALGVFWDPKFQEQKIHLSLARIALKEHIPTFGHDLTYILPYDCFCERISKLRDSGVGCDSLLYSCWRYCHEEARSALYSFYVHLFDNNLADSEVDFLTSRLVFIQKGRIDADQAGNCRRHPSKTRPLNLANTDCKIISCMISIILSVVCSVCITTQQAGGMKGKQMIDHIFTLEAKIIDYIVRNVPNSGIFALDIASAFPSLSRKYLFWVLKNIGLPKPFRRLIASLHKTSKGIICFRNLLFATLYIATGVKQGDPSAMQLFVIGYDPLIKFISASLSPVDHTLLPYCDDVALAVVNVLLAWQILLKCFDMIGKMSSLHLNNEKTQFLLTSSTQNEDIDAMMTYDGRVSMSQFSSTIKYLGMFLGPECADINWDHVLCDFLVTARFISSLDCGLLTKISLYNMLAISKLSYVASFLPPNVSVLKAENRALQLLCRGPWNAIPPSLLKSVRAIGMPSQATDLTVLSIAAKIRVAHVTSQNVFAKSNEIDNVYNGFDIVLKYLDYKLCNSTCIKSICHAYSDFVSHNDIHGLGVLTQHKVYKEISKQRSPFCFKGFISMKASRILNEAPSDRQISNVISGYLFASDKSFALTFTHIRAISNHWCTRSRFGAKNQGCIFICGHETDAIRHTCVCKKYWDAFFRVSRIAPFTIDLKKIMIFSDGSNSVCNYELHSIFIGLHICFLCFNSCRHGHSLSDRLIQHHLSHFMRQHHKVASVFQTLQNSMSSNLPPP